MEVDKGKVHQKSKRKTKMFFKGVDGCPPQTNFLSFLINLSPEDLKKKIMTLLAKCDI